jgi:hypothetical protein
VENENFTNNYLKPSISGLDSSFTLPLPDIPGLQKSGEFIVQGTLEQTVSTNIIAKYLSETAGVRCVEVYKNTEEAVEGRFIRLVGTMSLLKKGYPFLFLDAAVSNINFLTGQIEGITTRVAMHLPQADSDKRNLFFDTLSQQAECTGLTYTTREIESMPGFWGPLWSAQSEGIAFDIIKTLRGCAWTSYEHYCSQADSNPEFDYKPVQHQMILKTSQAEHHFFKKMGLAVAAEAQAAFFSVLSADV